METIIIKEEVIEICQKLAIANDNMYKAGGLDLACYKEEMNESAGLQMIAGIKENFDLAVESMVNGLQKSNTSSKDMLDIVKRLLAESEILVSKHDKLIALANKDVETIVVDPHFGISTNTTIHTVLNKEGDIVDYVALDRLGNIIRVYQNGEQLVLDNSTSYGAVRYGKLNGWCYDRDSYTIPGFESSEYYKER